MSTPNSVDWRATLKAEVADLPLSTTSSVAEAIPCTLDFLPGAYGVVQAAARARRTSVAAFTRRAAYAMAAHDLGLPLADLMARDPRMVRETGRPIADPEGRKFGTWEIEKLMGGAGV